MPSKLASDVLEFTDVVETLDTPVAVLDALDAITWGSCNAHVLGAALLPLNFWNHRLACSRQDGLLTPERTAGVVGGTHRTGSKISGSR
jgi:hypothetical protein